MLYRTAGGATLLTTLASAGVGAAALHARGPAVAGTDGAETARSVVAVAQRQGVTATVWDGDTALDLPGVYRQAAETAAQLLVVEWHPTVGGGDATRFSGGDPLARSVLADPPCDVLLVRAGELDSIDEVVVAVGHGPNVPLLAGLARHWAEAFGVSATVLHRVETDDDVPAARALCRRVAPGLTSRIVVGRDLANLLTEVATRTGFIAIGATEDLPMDRVASRAGAALTRRGGATVVIGRTGPRRR
ncbi:MAG TPA: hypothetical protein VG452_13000 [Egibacteraceae bacterium]|nr:hypothetical protein [Egibacteraceae bacterium]